MYVHGCERQGLSVSVNASRDMGTWTVACLPFITPTDFLSNSKFVVIKKSVRDEFLPIHAYYNFVVLCVVQMLRMRR
jgi:hypothetical protein